MELPVSAVLNAALALLVAQLPYMKTTAAATAHILILVPCIALKLLAVVQRRGSEPDPCSG
ncbi:hypothetical protein LOZ65_006906, partial [Ophidiomyces ophidiicola]